MFLSEYASHIGAFLKKLPLVELSTLFILAIITIFRKRLSSNDEYRRKNAPKTIAKKIEKPCGTKPGRDSYTLDLTILSSDTLTHLLGYLDTTEIIQVMQASKPLLNEVRADRIWEQLWIQTYSNMWQNIRIKKIREQRGIYWDPRLNFGPPQQGWFHFYIMFEVCWLDWILAGFCTTSCCLLAISGSIYDVTQFMHEHPGSLETLTEGSGCDATESFQEIGHSSHAVRMLKKFPLWDGSSNRNSSNNNNIDNGTTTSVSIRNNNSVNNNIIETNESVGSTEQDKEESRKSNICSNNQFVKSMQNNRLFLGTRNITIQQTKLHNQMKVNKTIITNLAMKKNKKSFLKEFPAALSSGGSEAYRQLLYQTVQLGNNISTVTANVTANASAAASTITASAAAAATSITEGVSTLATVTTGRGLSFDEVEEEVYRDSDKSGRAGYASLNSNSSSNGVAATRQISCDGDFPFLLDEAPIYSGYMGDRMRSPPPVSASTSAPAEGEGNNSTTEAYFTHPHKVVPALNGYFDCAAAMAEKALLAANGGMDENNDDNHEYHEHFGQCRVCFDPLSQDWTVWWTCCGKGEILVEATSPQTQQTHVDNSVGESDADTPSSPAAVAAFEGGGKKKESASIAALRKSSYFASVNQQIKPELIFLSLKNMYKTVKELVV